MEKRNLVEKKIYEEKAYRIVADLAIKTIDETALTSIVTIYTKALRHLFAKCKYNT